MIDYLKLEECKSFFLTVHNSQYQIKSQSLAHELLIVMFVLMAEIKPFDRRRNGIFHVNPLTAHLKAYSTHV